MIWFSEDEGTITNEQKVHHDLTFSEMPAKNDYLCYVKLRAQVQELRAQSFSSGCQPSTAFQSPSLLFRFTEISCHHH